MAIRLIQTDTLHLELFVGDPKPEYAILSHVWKSKDEISFHEMIAINNNPNDPARHKSGYEKIIKTCEIAKNDNIKYAWVDTCCIDKTSSSELSEAINSMFRWYKEAKICYAILSDYKQAATPYESLKSCRWFTRGWCLQELLASRELNFYDAKWKLIDSKAELSSTLSEISQIDEDVLKDRTLITSVPIARRMSWAAKRQTTREEDMAYCLLGIFNINMPMLYGEGTKAFIRLQEEIVKSNNDLSIFAFPQSGMDSRSHSSLTPDSPYRNVFATSPSEFETCKELVHQSTPHWSDSYSLTNKGLYFHRAKLEIDIERSIYLLGLHCETNEGKRKVMSLQKIGPGLYARREVRDSNLGSSPYAKIEEDIYILTTISALRQRQIEQADDYAIHIQSPDHDLSSVLQILQRSASSDRWDIARMQFLTLGERTTAFWKVFPKLARAIGERECTGKFSAGPAYLVCGLEPEMNTLEPVPWLFLCSETEWRQLEKSYGIITDLNDASVFPGGRTTDKVTLGGTVIEANIKLDTGLGRPRFNLTLELKNVSEGEL
ncbi:hypothetical protein F4860DRAFT_392126 [Xylaria cubensis]|nr:hypothetical protein F4860DRAFT_392126 [Xylaria cubensis]